MEDYRLTFNHTITVHSKNLENAKKFAPNVIKYHLEHHEISAEDFYHDNSEDTKTEKARSESVERLMNDMDGVFANDGLDPEAKLQQLEDIFDTHYSDLEDIARGGGF